MGRTAMCAGHWIAAATLGVLAACANLPPPTKQQLEGLRQEYVCRDGTVFIAEFDADARNVRLTFKDRTVLLPLRASTDALVRYGDGETSFGTDGREAGIADQIRIIHSGCVAR